MVDSFSRQILISGNAPMEYPSELYFGILKGAEGIVLSIPIIHPFKGEWGTPLSIVLTEREIRIFPQKINMVWLSIVEKNFYELFEDLPVALMDDLWNQKLPKSFEKKYQQIVVGMAPYGGVAIWLDGLSKSTLIAWYHAKKASIKMSDFLPSNPDISLSDFCNIYISDSRIVKENLEKNGLPPLDLFDKYMQQFTYRYVVRFAHWDEENEDWKDYTEDEILPNLDYIEESLFDGTHDKLHDGGLMQYHQAGKPKKLALQWTIKKSDYVAYLWFDDNTVRAAYETFYTQYPNAKMDFIFCIDVEKQKYQVSFNCEEAEMPMLLSEEAYQMIIFKSKFEYYRTPNYNQPRGAWVW